jgi:hypothetical protein
MPFEFLVDVYDYIEIVKDEEGIILAWTQKTSIKNFA